MQRYLNTPMAPCQRCKHFLYISKYWNNSKVHSYSERSAGSSRCPARFLRNSLCWKKLPTFTCFESHFQTDFQTHFWSWIYSPFFSSMFREELFVNSVLRPELQLSSETSVEVGSRAITTASSHSHIQSWL